MTEVQRGGLASGAKSQRHQFLAGAGVPGFERVVPGAREQPLPIGRPRAGTDGSAMVTGQIQAGEDVVRLVEADSLRVLSPLLPSPDGEG